MALDLEESLCNESQQRGRIEKDGFVRAVGGEVEGHKDGGWREEH